MRRVLITWAAAWPTITVLLLALEGMMAGWPLVLRTLLLTGLMGPAMLLVVPYVSGLIGCCHDNPRNQCPGKYP